MEDLVPEKEPQFFLALNFGSGIKRFIDFNSSNLMNIIVVVCVFSGKSSPKHSTQLQFYTNIFKQLFAFMIRISLQLLRLLFRSSRKRLRNADGLLVYEPPNEAVHANGEPPVPDATTANEYGSSTKSNVWFYVKTAVLFYLIVAY